MKRLFIIGASILQLPAIQKAKVLGFYVGTQVVAPKKDRLLSEIYTSKGRR